MSPPLFVSGHQPSLFGWLPYWEKILRSDLHIVASYVDWSHGDTRLNRLTLAGQKVTIPVAHRYDRGPIREVRTMPNAGPALVKTLHSLYGKKYKHRDRLEPFLALLDQPGEMDLTAVTMEAMKITLKHLSYRGQVVEDGPPDGVDKVFRSINRLARHGCDPFHTTYLCGPGTADYLRGHGYPFRVSVQSVANAGQPEAQVSVLDVLLTSDNPRESLLAWCRGRVMWSEPSLV